MLLSQERAQRCPVCNQPHLTAANAVEAQRGGTTHFLCCDQCRDEFLQAPCCHGRPKGRVSRWLDRLARANQKEFGPKGPNCC